jgi:hypothetical protein
MPDQISRPVNHQWRVVRVWVFLTILFLAACFVPGLAGIDGMDGGFAIITICGMLVISGIVTLAFYVPRARRLDKMLNEDNFLVAWMLSDEEWKSYLAMDLAADKGLSKSTFILITVISLVIGIFLSVVFKDLLFMIIIAGLIAFLSLPAFTFPLLRSRRKRRNPPLVMIGENALYVGGSFSNWGSMGASLNGSELDTSTNPAILTLSVVYPTRTGMSEDHVRVPVPTGKLSEIPALVAKLGLKPYDGTSATIGFCCKCGSEFAQEQKFCRNCGNTL